MLESYSWLRKDGLWDELIALFTGVSNKLLEYEIYSPAEIYRINELCRDVLLNRTLPHIRAEFWRLHGNSPYLLRNPGDAGDNIGGSTKDAKK